MQDAPRAIEALKALDVPYMVSLPLVFQTTEEWLESELGVHPVQVALQVRAFSLHKGGSSAESLHLMQSGMCAVLRCNRNAPL